MIETVHTTTLGRVLCGDAMDVLRATDDDSADLIVTSPPYAIQLRKMAGQVRGSEYVDWILPHAREWYRVVKPSGSVVVNLGGAWNRGEPTRDPYQWRTLLALIDDVGFRLAQDCYWWNSAALPSPVEWTNARRIRVKSAVEHVYWLAKTAWPKASNRRVLTPYSEAMRAVVARGSVDTRKYPSGYTRRPDMARDLGVTVNTIIRV